MINLNNLKQPCLEVIALGHVRKVPTKIETCDDGGRVFLTPDIDKLTPFELRALLENVRTRAQQFVMAEQAKEEVHEIIMDNGVITELFDHKVTRHEQRA
tara:strand:- start:598 stop:897 length:300 start_codon:yes stop_codon:yes gene_type:complete